MMEYQLAIKLHPNASQTEVGLALEIAADAAARHLFKIDRNFAVDESCDLQGNTSMTLSRSE